MNDARYYDGKTAAARDVTLTLTGGGLLIETPGREVIAIWPFDEIAPFRRDDTGAARVARRGDGASLVCRDGVLLNVLRRHVPKDSAGRGWLPVTFLVGGALVVIGLFFWLGLPLFAGQVAAALPPAWEERLGRNVAQQIDSQVGKGHACTGAEGRAALDRLARLLTDAVPPRAPLHLHVVDTKIVNAFALPGGHVLVFRGLLDFAEHPNELAGVLAHEMGHSDLRHPAETSIKRGVGALAIGLLLGDVTGLSATVVIGQALVASSYTREAEAAADDHAFATLAKAGLTAAPFAAFFERLEKKEGGTGGLFALLQTHPASTDRAARARAADRRRGGEALNAAEWRALKKICG